MGFVVSDNWIWTVDCLLIVAFINNVLLTLEQNTSSSRTTPVPDPGRVTVTNRHENGWGT